MHSPELLLLDEPTVGLDPHIRRKIWSFIKSIQAKGTTILLTTHYMEEAETLSDRVAFINKGEIVAIDTPSNFIKKLGNYAIDIFTDNGINTQFFQTKEEAEETFLKLSQKYNYVSFRKITLEDVFIKLTGERV
jgi:ABC-2 type transport system ATP-binding protein